MWLRAKWSLAAAGLIAGWVMLVPRLVLPPARQPWTQTVDLSRWVVASTLPAGWEVHRDPQFPGAVTTRLPQTAILPLRVSAPGPALLKLKVRFADLRQQLQLDLNGSRLATVMPAAGESVTRWRATLPAAAVRVGTNELVFTNSQPAHPLVVEKVELGNVRRALPALGVVVLADSLDQRWAGLGYHVVLVVAGLAVAGAAVWLMTALAGAGGVPVRSRWIGLAPPAAVVLTAGAAAIGNVVTPYTGFIMPGVFWSVGINAWWLGVGLVCYAMAASGERPAGTATAGGLARLGRFVSTPAFRRWGCWAAVGTIGVLALAERAVAYLPRLMRPFADFHTGHDASVYLATAVQIAQQEPFFLSLLQAPHFPLLYGVWNSPVVLSTLVGGFMKVWGVYPGLIYWGWALVILSSAACLVPYAWQRGWGAPGVGGLIVGFWLATSRLMQEQLPVVMTDLLGMVLLGGAFLLVARLARQESWRAVLAAGLGLIVLAYSRTANALLSAFLVLALGIGWAWTAADRRQARRRLARWAGLVALTVAGIVGVQRLLLGPQPHLFLAHLAGGHWAWAAQHGAAESGDQARWWWESLAVPAGALWRDQLLWVVLMPACLGFGVWCAVRRRTPEALPVLLVLIPWLGYLAMLLPGSHQVRYALPWLLLEGLLAAQCFDAVWSRVCRHPSPAVWAGMTLIVLLLVGPPVWSAGQQTVAQGRQAAADRARAAAYLEWLSPQLPDDAVILVSHRVDPWAVARRLNKPVICSNGAWGVGLLVDPHLLTPPQPFTAEALAQAASDTTEHLVDRCLTAGATVVVLDPAADPEALAYFLDPVPERLGSFPGWRYQAREVIRDRRGWAWHAVTARSREASS